MNNSRANNPSAGRILNSRVIYYVWALPVSALLLSPPVMFIRGLDNLGDAGPAAAAPITAFSVGMAASVLAAPLFRQGGPMRLISASLGLLSGLMGIALSVIAVIYFDNLALLAASAACGTVGVYLALRNARSRWIAPVRPARLAAVPLINTIVVVVLGYVMLQLAS